MGGRAVGGGAHYLSTHIPLFYYQYVVNHHAPDDTKSGTATNEEKARPLRIPLPALPAQLVLPYSQHAANLSLECSTR